MSKKLHKSNHGGYRPGAGRPRRQLTRGEQRRAVWIYATDADVRRILALSHEDRKAALLTAVAALPPTV